MKLVAVTSCPTGIAHTYMAAESLEQAAKAAGHTITVETQGAGGADPVPADVIAAADAVIFAADVEVRGRERFIGKALVTAPVKRAINAGPELIEEAVHAAEAGSPEAAATPAAAPHSATARPAGAHRDVLAGLTTKVDKDAHFGTRLRQWLMTGVSYMIPFVAAGGILIAISFIWGGPQVASKVFGGTFHGHTYHPVITGIESFDVSAVLHAAGYAGLLFLIGKVAFFMLVPVLSGFIAYAMADRMGLVPGFVAGLIATATGAGFLGGLIGGLLAGTAVLAVKRVRVPRAFAGIMPVVVIPLLSTAFVGVIMAVVVARPVAAATTAMTNWLHGLSGANAAVLGLLLGAMMAFDLGGPVNKVAYTFGLAGLASGNTKVMAAVMVAGMTPPIALALACVVRKRLFTPAERTAGEAAWLLGLSFITEGAIPFAAADPLRVIPSMMAGSAAAGALSMAFGVTSLAPHGGIWVIGLIGRPLLYLVAIAAGVVVSAVCVIVLKSLRRTEPAEPTGTRADATNATSEPVAVGA
ncbi:MAG TPA: fructose-specific PTS transporter subunit EIIC [Streptosporangiaceae bacterium]|nr:fructose-specific PTS transporter subunit EIIC [Streptosporangiaceae bacterium]